MVSERQTYIVTGATGFLGKHVVSHLHAQGSHLVLLGRAKNGQTYSERIADFAHDLGLPDTPDSWMVLEVDFQGALLGLNGSQLETLSNLHASALIHMAAELSFDNRKTHSVRETNIDALIRVLDLCKHLATRFIFVSTAFVHGKDQQILVEDQPNEQNHLFNNDYERSKFYGERLVRKYHSENKIPAYTIVRPSLLIEIDKKPGKFSGYYVFIASLYKLVRSILTRKVVIPFILSPSEDAARLTTMKVFLPFIYFKDCNLNIMRVEVASRWLCDIISSDYAKNRTFNIVNIAPMPFHDMITISLDEIGLSMNVIGTSQLVARGYYGFVRLMALIVPPLRGISRKLKYYEHYLTARHSYETANVRAVIGERINEGIMSHEELRQSLRSFIHFLSTTKPQ